MCWPARASAIRSLLDEGEKKLREAEAGKANRTLRADFERVREFFNGDLPADGAQGLAVFCSGENELFEVIRLPRPVQSEVVISDSPFIEPLVDLVSGTWCILLCNRRTARVFRGSSDSIDEVADDRDGPSSWSLHGDALGDRRPGHLGRHPAELVAHGRAALGLNTDDLDVGTETPQRDRDAGDEPAAPDRDDDGLDVGEVFDDLERHASLPGDHVGIIEG